MSARSFSQQQLRLMKLLRRSRNPTIYTSFIISDPMVKVLAPFSDSRSISRHINTHFLKKNAASVGVWFSSRLYYPFGKGPGQHIIRCLKNKKCENERIDIDSHTGWRLRDGFEGPGPNRTYCCTLFHPSTLPLPKKQAKDTLSAQIAIRSQSPF